MNTNAPGTYEWLRFQATNLREHGLTNIGEGIERAANRMKLLEAQNAKLRAALERIEYHSRDRTTTRLDLRDALQAALASVLRDAERYKVLEEIIDAADKDEREVLIRWGGKLCFSLDCGADTLAELADKLREENERKASIKSIGC